MTLIFSVIILENSSEESLLYQIFLEPCIPMSKNYEGDSATLFHSKITLYVPLF